jgi:hypothetical protein
MEPIQRTQPTEQLCLFGAPRILPRWEDLPPRIREEVVQLLEKTLIDYGRQMIEDPAPRKEPPSE